MNDLLFALWFFVPAGLANVMALVISKVPVISQWSYPLDCYMTLSGKRILGDHKTVRGLVSGIVFGVLVSYFQLLLYTQNQWLRELFPIWHTDFFALGFALAFGSLVGDMVKSFWKRRIGVAPGKVWIPFDQIDYVIGGIVGSLFVVSYSFSFYLLVFVVWSVLHPVATTIGYLLHLKKTPL